MINKELNKKHRIINLNIKPKSEVIFAENVPQKNSNFIEQNIIESLVPTPTPTPTPSSIPTTRSLSFLPSSEVIKQYIIAKFGSKSSEALCIAEHESGIRADAIHLNYNGTYDVGVFQINDVHGLSLAYRENYINNINYAYILSGAGNNWNAWTTSFYCS